MYIIHTIKKRLHREIVADPVLHGLVLNLYMNGEQYPHRVEDYFPIAQVDNPELAALMTQHASDEDKHVILYSKAIQRLEQPLLELAMPDIFNHVIRSHTAPSFAIQAQENRDQRQLKIAHFLAHAHYLEKRIARSLEYHIEACANSPSPYSVKAVAAVMRDENRHVSYTREAVLELLPKPKALELFSIHQQAEAKANLDFSARQLGRLLRLHAERFSLPSRLLYSNCTRLLRTFLAHA